MRRRSSATTSHAVGRGDRLPASRDGARLLHHNALYWLEEYRFDGLRFDAVHAIDDSEALCWTNRASDARTPMRRTATSIWCWRTTTTTRCWRTLRAAALSTRNGTTTSTTSLHVLLTGETRRLLCRLSPTSRPQLGALPGGRLRLPGRSVGSTAAAAARRAERAICRRPPSCFPAEPRPDRQPRLRRAADGRSPSRGADARPSRCCCCRPQIRCCSWVRNGRDARLPVFHRLRRRARRRGARRPPREFAQIRGLRDRAPARAASPIPNAPQPSRPPSPIPPRRSGRRMMRCWRCTAGSWRCGMRASCRICRCPRDRRPGGGGCRGARPLAAGRWQRADLGQQSRRAPSPARRGARSSSKAWPGPPVRWAPGPCRRVAPSP